MENNLSAKTEADMSSGMVLEVKGV
jgi:hypothetical protein